MYKNIPDELKRMKQWVCWQKKIGVNGKTIKKPINPNTGFGAKSTSPDTWSDFETAVRASERYNGIGFVFANGYFGVDIDNVKDDIDQFKYAEETGREVHDNIVYEFVHCLGGYAEYSQSGNGIHIICKGKLPEGRNRKGNVEMYSENRYFIMTGNIILPEYTQIIDCTEKIKPLYNKYISGGDVQQKLYVTPKTNLSITEIIEKAKSSKQGNLFSNLLSGNWEGTYNSQSEADMAFCNMLAFWTGNNYHMMDEIYRSSGLMRDKWDDMHGAKTYGEITINEAITKCVEVYNSPKKQPIRTNTSKLGFTEFIDSLEQEPIKRPSWLIDRLLYKNAVNLISGDPKTYKTYLAIDMSIATILGGYALGDKFVCEDGENGKVLFISPEFDTRDRFIKILRERECEPYHLKDKLYLPTQEEVEFIAWSKDKEAIIKAINEIEPALVVLDPITYIYDGEITKNEEVREFFREIKSLVKSQDTTFLLTTHNNRMQTDKRMNNVSGAAAVTRFADSIIYLERFKEDEEQDIFKSDEELDTITKEIKLIKGAYRYGGEGYKYHKVGFNFLSDRTIITSERYSNQDTENFHTPRKVSYEVIEYEINRAVKEGKLGVTFTKNDVLMAIPNNTGLSEDTFRRYVENVLPKMSKEGKINALPGKGYSSQISIA